MNQPKSSTDMRCTSCGSMYTQFVPTCFSLTRQSGKYDPENNEFHGLIEKPKRRSILAIPMLAGIGTLIAVTDAVIIRETVSDRPWTLMNNEQWLGVLVPGLFVGIAVSLVLWLRARRFNRDVFPSRYEEWSSTAICRRCSTRFPAPDRIVAAYRSSS